jgi:hypothetical protein
MAKTKRPSSRQKPKTKNDIKQKQLKKRQKQETMERTTNRKRKPRSNK